MLRLPIQSVKPSEIPAPNLKAIAIPAFAFREPRTFHIRDGSA